MRNKKADMGMGTLIIFIAMILVAAVAASVLIATTSKLQNKALDTGKLTTQEVGTGLQAIEVFGEDGSDQDLDYWYETIKLAAGSDALRFSDVLLTMSLSDQSRDYTYIDTNLTVNITDNGSGEAAGQAINYYIQPPNCGDDIGTLNSSQYNYSTMCVQMNWSDTSSGTVCRNLTYGFGIEYQIQGTSYKSGYLNKGDVVKLCWEAPREINESEDVKISLVPKVGSILVVETTTPDLMVDKRVGIFP